MQTMKLRGRPKNGSSSPGFSNILLALNAVLMAGLIFHLRTPSPTSSANNEGSLLTKADPSKQQEEVATTAQIPSHQEEEAQRRETEVRSFLDIAKRTGTDKVLGHQHFKPCLEENRICVKDADKTERNACKPWGHFYDTLYQRWLEPYSGDSVDTFQFLEIGFYQGKGFKAYQDFMPRAEAHSIEISCVKDGATWSLGNTAKQAFPDLYEQLIAENRLHCGSAADLDFLNQVWNNHINRPGSPPLKVVVDDASHLAQHMIQSVFFWFPKIEPGGFMIVEDIQPIPSAGAFRTDFLPQVMSDLHYCGFPSDPQKAFFLTLYPLMHSISCEMHICIFERNQEPATIDLPVDKLTPPSYALDYAQALQAVRSTPVV